MNYCEDSAVMGFFVILCIISAVIGFIFLLIKGNRDVKRVIGSVLMIAGSGLNFLALLFYDSSKPTAWYDEGNPTLHTVSLIASIVLFAAIITGIVLVFKGFGSENDSAMMARIQEQNKQQVIIDNESKIWIYNACLKSGITALDNEKNIQKFRLFANSKGIGQGYKTSDLIALFNECKTLADSKEKQEQLNKTEQLKRDEEKECKLLEKYSNYIGRDKRIAILTDKKNEAMAQADNKRDAASAVMDVAKMSYIKEQDWALRGGLASGIAGPAAGLATALDSQSKNSQIRAHNESVAKNAVDMQMKVLKEASKYKIQADRYDKMIEESKLKLVSNDSAQVCFSKLVFEEPTVNVSETGTCRVGVSIRAKENLLIFDDVDAVIDGTIIASIYDGQRKIGTAKLVLPTFGIDSTGYYVEGMSLFSGTKGASYMVRFDAEKLWAMER